MLRRQELPEDLHSKRIATDADNWISWLERLAEIRRGERESVDAALRYSVRQCEGPGLGPTIG
jgi:hypothetical protein